MGEEVEGRRVPPSQDGPVVAPPVGGGAGQDGPGGGPAAAAAGRTGPSEECGQGPAVSEAGQAAEPVGRDRAYEIMRRAFRVHGVGGVRVQPEAAADRASQAIAAGVMGLAAAGLLAPPAPAGAVAGREAAYEAVYRVIRAHPPRSRDEHGAAAENARVWRAVTAALAAVGVTAELAEAERRAAELLADYAAGERSERDARAWLGLGRPPAGQAPTTLTVPDGPKALRESLCVAQTALGYHPVHPRRREHVDRLGRLIDECDRHRPLGPDGRHGDRHTATCGCEDRPADSPHAPPAVGERVVDGGVPGTLVRCTECSGSGLLHQPDPGAVTPGPEPEAEPVATESPKRQPPERRPQQPLSKPGNEIIYRTVDGWRQVWRQYGWIDHLGRMYDLGEYPSRFRVTSFAPLWVQVDNERIPDVEEDIQADTSAAAAGESAQLSSDVEADTDPDDGPGFDRAAAEQIVITGEIPAGVDVHRLLGELLAANERQIKRGDSLVAEAARQTRRADRASARLAKMERSDAWTTGALAEAHATLGRDRAQAGWAGVLAAHLRFVCQAVEQAQAADDHRARVAGAAYPIGWEAVLLATGQARAALAAFDTDGQPAEPVAPPPVWMLPDPPPAHLDPSLIAWQRAAGWPDLHPEDYCERCGHRNIVWYTDSALWNRAVAGDSAKATPGPIWCPVCFARAYERTTGEHPVWRLAPRDLADEAAHLVASEARMRHRLQAVEEELAQLREGGASAAERLLADSNRKLRDAVEHWQGEANKRVAELDRTAELGSELARVQERNQRLVDEAARLSRTADKLRAELDRVTAALTRTEERLAKAERRASGKDRADEALDEIRQLFGHIPANTNDDPRLVVETVRARTLPPGTWVVDQGVLDEVRAEHDQAQRRVAELEEQRDRTADWRACNVLISEQDAAIDHLRADLDRAQRSAYAEQTRLQFKLAEAAARLDRAREALALIEIADPCGYEWRPGTRCGRPAGHAEGMHSDEPTEIDQAGEARRAHTELAEAQAEVRRHREASDRLGVQLAEVSGQRAQAQAERERFRGWNNDARRQLAGRDGEITGLRALLRRVLAQFTEYGHPGWPARRTGWIRAETVDAWKRATSNPVPGPIVLAALAPFPIDPARQRSNTRGAYSTWDPAAATDEPDGLPDKAIVPLVETLRERGITTLQSCAGHPGTADGTLWIHVATVDEASLLYCLRGKHPFDRVQLVAWPDRWWELTWHPDRAGEAIHRLGGLQPVVDPAARAAAVQRVGEALDVPPELIGLPRGPWPADHAAAAFGNASDADQQDVRPDATSCCQGTGYADYAAVPCPNPECAAVPEATPAQDEPVGSLAYDEPGGGPWGDASTADRRDVYGQAEPVGAEPTAESEEEADAATT